MPFSSPLYYQPCSLCSTDNRVLAFPTKTLHQKRPCRDVIALVDCLYVTPNQTDSADPPPGPIHIAGQELNDLVEIVIPMILQFANPNPVPQVLPPHIAEALYLRAIFEATARPRRDPWPRQW
jgi:hypothetical protein